jgi:hypothetical protein
LDRPDLRHERQSLTVPKWLPENVGLLASELYEDRLIDLASRL